MGYGMKYTKGGFPFKSSPAKIDLTKKTGMGPRATVKKTELEKMTEEEYQKYMNEKHHSNVPTFTNSNPSPNDKALANAKSKQMTESSDLEKNDDDRSYSIKEAAAGDKQEKKEDAEGK